MIAAGAGPAPAGGVEVPRDAIRLEEGATPHGWKTSGSANGKSWMSTGKWSNFRFHLEGEATPGEKAVLSFGDVGKMELRIGASGKVELDAAFEGLPGKPRVLRLWQDGGGVTEKQFPPPPDEAGGDALEVEIRLDTPGNFRTGTAWIQPLDRGDHAEIIREWGPESLQRGEKIYSALCSVCHGTLTQTGSLPTALRFGEAPFKNGSDPHSLWLTLTHGYGQMTPMPQYSTRDKYAVIHYIRETYLRPAGPGALLPPGPEYLASLPRGFITQEEVPDPQTLPEWLRMNFGPVLNYTYEVAPGNIAYKGIAVRVDEGAGGISKGRAWIVYDHDTMRMAAAWTGPDFIDWRSIAFDGSHQTHPKIVGTPLIINPPGPDWAHPELHHWDDPRLRGRDAKPYGPLPREWMQFRGRYVHGDRVVLRYSVGKTGILESPGLLGGAPVDVFTRTLNVEPSLETHHLRVAPADAAGVAGVAVALAGGDATTSLAVGDGFTVLTLLPSEKPRQLRLYLGRLAMADLEALVGRDTLSIDLHPLTKGGAPQFPELPETVLSSSADPGGPAAPFEIQNLTLPVENPWGSWMRPTGFDFLPDGETAAVCTWNGDVFRVHGIGQADGVLTWQRIAAGLSQPLGLKVYDGKIHVICRDQLAVLRDPDGDGFVDYLECFNNDHQVTEHFHEFAMGLQTDGAGNFYYAKSARHALPALVPQHGTLLRVSADGSRTDILAYGFRAANGVCLNPDGSFYVTDQEGHWMPKNRINHIPAGPPGFYGNMFGYHEIKDSRDEAMRPPVLWITNSRDRSPAELLWVPEGQWGELAGGLLMTSYGTGRVYQVLTEEVEGRQQGALVELPVPEFPTGVMRGRFHPRTGDLYLAGMAAWATDRTEPGGFYRMRRTVEPLGLPVALRVGKDGYALTFSAGLDAAAAMEVKRFELTTWSLRRSAGYGSPHLDEQVIGIAESHLLDPRTVLIRPEKHVPAQCYRLVWTLRGADGVERKGAAEGTVHAFP